MAPMPLKRQETLLAVNLGEYVRQGCLTLFKLFERFLRDVNKLQAKRIEAQQAREEE